MEYLNVFWKAVKQSRTLRSVICFLTILTIPALLKSEGLAGGLQVEVIDPFGAPVEASGRITGLTSGISRSFHTDAQGSYTLTNLPFGRYRLEISRTGFAVQSMPVQIQSEAVLSRTIQLLLGRSVVKVDVVASTPISGVNLSLDQVAAPVQTASQRDIEESGALELSDFLNRRFNGIYWNEMQGNPYQADLNFRGFTASPLLGTPQGLSVYMDGVRLNQPFGDLVSWDLIPRIAIEEVTLIPGSNPIFGLNALGGALSLETKSGSINRGTSLALTGGSFGRKNAEFEHGGSNVKGLDWYVAGNLYFEDGWRETSSSDVRQFFGKLGWQHGDTTIGLTAAYANNALTGNALQEQRFLARDYASVYTKPDITANRSPFVNLQASHNLGSALKISGNAYYRYIRTNSTSGDLNENSLEEAVYQPTAAERAALTSAGYTGFPTSGATSANTPFPSWRCIAQALLGDEPAEKCNGLLNRSHTEQQNYGLSGQITSYSSLFGRHNQVTAGGAFDRSDVTFLQTSQLGYVNADRSITGVNAFGDGVSGGTVDGVPYDTRVDLNGLVRTVSAYATDTLSIGTAWNVTLSGRYNRTTVRNNDRITPGGGPGSLDSHNVFDRFNPAAGVTYNASRYFNVYLSYSEGSRAPTSIELGCADPNQPCRLPNALASDPPLDQVVVRTWEAGLRGGQEGLVRWSAGAFRAENRNDLLFVASPQTGFGYFKNFGKTRRQGIELNVSSQIRRFTVGGGYTLLDATYQSPETVDGSSNSSNNGALEGAKGFDGTIHIEPGDRIPLVPRHMGKAFASVQATSKLSLDVNMLAVSGSYARGNENNQSEADGVYYLGPGWSPGYVVFNLGARYRVHRRVEIFGQVNNLLDRRYYTGAQLGATGFDASGAFLARPFAPVNGEYPLRHATFYAPGTPRGAWAGIRFHF